MIITQIKYNLFENFLFCGERKSLRVAKLNIVACISIYRNIYNLNRNPDKEVDPASKVKDKCLL